MSRSIPHWWQQGGIFEGARERTHEELVAFLNGHKIEVYHQAARSLAALGEENARLHEQLKTAVWSDSEECKFLTAENERLRARVSRLKGELSRLKAAL